LLLGYLKEQYPEHFPQEAQRLAHAEQHRPAPGMGLRWPAQQGGTL
jgi:hypothetical protein